LPDTEAGYGELAQVKKLPIFPMTPSGIAACLAL